MFTMVGGGIDVLLDGCINVVDRHACHLLSVLFSQNNFYIETHLICYAMLCCVDSIIISTTILDQNPGEYH